MEKLFVTAMEKMCHLRLKNERLTRMGGDWVKRSLPTLANSPNKNLKLLIYYITERTEPESSH